MIPESEEEERVWKFGEKLEAKWTDGEYYYGEISRVYKNGNYGFKYTDGSKDHHRYVSYLFPISSFSFFVLTSRSLEGHLIRERTPIVSWDESDIADGLSEDEDSMSEEEEVPEVLSGSKKYYWLAVREFLESQVGDCKYFLNGKRTNHTESFHNVCNLYCPKGSNISTKTYIMKKQFAALHWTENKQAQQQIEGELRLSWKVELLEKYLALKKQNSNAPKVAIVETGAKKIRLSAAINESQSNSNNTNDNIINANHNSTESRSKSRRLNNNSDSIK